MADQNVLASTRAALELELEHARTLLQRAEQEYADLLAGGDAIQEDRDAARQLVEEARASLAGAERALGQLDTGDYGRCTVCHEPIPPERLEALPHTTTCRSCS